MPYPQSRGCNAASLRVVVSACAWPPLGLTEVWRGTQSLRREPGVWTEYGSKASLSFKVSNINPHTLAGADAKNKTPNLQEAI